MVGACSIPRTDWTSCLPGEVDPNFRGNFDLQEKQVQVAKEYGINAVGVYKKSSEENWQDMPVLSCEECLLVF